MPTLHTRFHTEPPLTITGRVVRSVITTDLRDRSGDVVVPRGLRNMQAFLTNPVVLWAHDRRLPPIGTCVNLEIQPDRIIADTRFADTPFANELFQLYASGTLRAWSIGFVPVRGIPLASGGTRFTEWDLLEYSAVPIPENPQALTLAVQKALRAGGDVLAGLTVSSGVRS